MRKKMNVFLTRKLHDFAIKELKKYYNVEVHSGRFPIPKKILLQKIRNKDGLICFPYDCIDRDVISAAKNLKTISSFSVGYDHIDISYAKKKGIKIGYTPEVLTKATADLTFTLILDLLRRTVEGDRIIRKGKWTQVFGAHTFVGYDIFGKTLGILGLGRIGKEVSKRAKAFGMNIIYNNKNRLEKKEEKKLQVRYASFTELFKKSDVVSINVPYTKETHELIGMNLLKKMKKTAFLVNTSRGRVIKENDLVLALKKGIIAGAALDVFKNEPIGKNHPLAKLQNVVLVPHIGSSTEETRKEMAELTVENLKRGLSGRRLIYSVS